MMMMMICSGSRWRSQPGATTCTYFSTCSPLPVPFPFFFSTCTTIALVAQFSSFSSSSSSSFPTFLSPSNRRRWWRSPQSPPPPLPLLRFIIIILPQTPNKFWIIVQLDLRHNFHSLVLVSCPSRVLARSLRLRLIIYDYARLETR